MGTGSLTRTDLYTAHGIIQNSMLSYSKALFVETLRESFSSDSFYHYVRDDWGFPKTPDHTDLSPDAGMNDDAASRIFIGEISRHNMKYYPSILIKGGGFKSVPISMSRNEGFVQYKASKIIDGYGNEKIYSVPDSFVTAGAYEGSISIDITTGDTKSRDELAEIVTILLTEVHFNDFYKSGVIVRPPQVGSPTEVEDNNERLYKLTITCDVRCEWRRSIPITSTVDAINFCIDFGNLEPAIPAIAPNIEINSLVQFIEDL